MRTRRSALPQRRFFRQLANPLETGISARRNFSFCRFLLIAHGNPLAPSTVACAERRGMAAIPGPHEGRVMSDKQLPADTSPVPLAPLPAADWRRPCTSLGAISLMDTAGMPLM